MRRNDGEQPPGRGDAQRRRRVLGNEVRKLLFESGLPARLKANALAKQPLIEAGRDIVKVI